MALGELAIRIGLPPSSGEFGTVALPCTSGIGRVRRNWSRRGALSRRYSRMAVCSAIHLCLLISRGCGEKMMIGSSPSSPNCCYRGVLIFFFGNGSSHSIPVAITSCGKEKSFTTQGKNLCSFALFLSD